MNLFTYRLDSTVAFDPEVDEDPRNTTVTGTLVSRFDIAALNIAIGSAAISEGAVTVLPPPPVAVPPTGWLLITRLPSTRCAYSALNSGAYAMACLTTGGKLLFASTAG